jgi:Rap1a immunity proteins
MRVIICAMLMTLTVTAARAEDYLGSASFVLPGCKRLIVSAAGGNVSPAAALTEGICWGIVEATGNMLDLAKEVQARSPSGRPGELKMACADIPRAVTIGQRVQVVIGYVEAHPNRMRENFHVLATEALMTAWPCRQ